MRVVFFGGVPDAADASRAIAACGSQAAGVAAIRICFGCDGQFAGVFFAIIVLFVVLEAGMVATAGEGIVALQRDRRVARALDAEGGVVFGLNVDIVQRHVEGVVIAFDLVDDLDDVVGDVFGCALEVFRRAFQGRGRFVPGLFVVIGVGDLEGCAGVRELASQHRAVAGLGLFRGISLVFLAAGGVVGLVLVFLAGGGVVRAFALRGRASRAGGVAGLVLVFLAAGGAAGLVLVFLAAGGVVVELVLVFFAAGGVAGLVLVFLAAGGVVGLVLVFLAAGGVAGLVLVFLAGGVVGLVLAFLAAALGVAEVDLVFGFVVAVVFGVKCGQLGLGGRGCGGAAGRRAAAGRAAAGGGGIL